MAQLVHGGGHSALSWALCAAALKKSYACVAFDLRAHGLTQTADEKDLVRPAWSSFPNLIPLWLLAVVRHSGEGHHRSVQRPVAPEGSSAGDGGSLHGRPAGRARRRRQAALRRRTRRRG